MLLYRYNDGDPLSATDQSYVLDNVFNYHPDKAAKMGAGIDHITVCLLISVLTLLSCYTSFNLLNIFCLMLNKLL